MNFIDKYTEFLGSFSKIDCPIKMVFDSSNGTTGPILKNLFGENKLVSLDLINSEPDQISYL
jgi:phosphomannomutase